MALPRVGALALSSDGSRLSVSVHTLDAEKKKWQSALWEVDPAGQRPARGSRGARPASPPRVGTGRLALFTSPARPDAAENGDPSPGCGACLPTAVRHGSSCPAGGVASVVVAADSGDVVCAAATMRGGGSAPEKEQDRAPGGRTPG